MDDFNTASLQESKNEWCIRLIGVLSPCIIEGLKSIFEESKNLCSSTGEDEKYLMTFQNFLARVPKWNASIIEEERRRIVEKSNCHYIEDLITCVHVIQLKLLTAIRVGQKQKKININIPKLDDFIHKVYINTCRKIYSNVYLFEVNIQTLQIQKNNRELEMIVQECILVTIRESIPIDTILKAYLDETIEEYVEEQVIEKEVKQVKKQTKRRRDDMEDIKISKLDEPSDNEVKMLEKINEGTRNISFDNINDIKIEPKEPMVELSAPKVEIPQMEFPKLEFDLKPMGLEEVSLGELPSVDDDIMVLNL